MHHPSDACCGRIPIEFPIEPTAPPLPTNRDFVPLLGRLPSTRVDGTVMQASEKPAQLETLAGNAI